MTDPKVLETDGHRERRIEADRDACTLLDAALIVGRCHGCAGTSSRTGRRTNRGRLSTLAEEPAGRRASRGADGNLLHVLARGLIADLRDVSFGDARLDGIRLAAELD